MGLTRERWYCARGWLSRLDMNTCQTIIKNSILLMYIGPHPGYQTHETPQQVVPNRTNQRGEGQADEQVSQTRIVDRNYGNYHSIPLIRIVY